MSNHVDKARQDIDDAKKEYIDAKKELEDWKNKYKEKLKSNQEFDDEVFDDHPRTKKLEAKVDRFTRIIEGAQKNYDAALAANTGAVPADLYETLDNIVHRRISELRQPKTEQMSQCSASKFEIIKNYFAFKFNEMQWAVNPIPLKSGFQWQDGDKDACIPDIISFFTRNLQPYQFKDSRHIFVSINYFDGESKFVNTGKLDITALLPRQVATQKQTILSQCIVAIEIKTPTALKKDIERCINQSRLQLLALNIHGNDHKPFALLTDAVDYWNFTWLARDNNFISTIFDNQQQGLAALKKGLDMMNGKRNNCPFVDRCFLNFPDNVAGGEGGANDDIANLTDFYDEMTPEEIFEHKTKIDLSKIFQCMNPSQRLDFESVFTNCAL